MSRQWKPGDVAMVTSGDVKRKDPRACAEFETVIGVRTGREGGPGGWNQADGHWIDEDYVYDARPLVVIDPEDREQVERIWREQDRGIAAIREANPDQVGVSLVDALQVGLRRMLDPEHTPKPEEPLGLGAVVEDAEGAHWIKVDEHNGCNDWIQKTAGPANRTFYRDIAAVRVLSEGVTE